MAVKRYNGTSWDVVAGLGQQGAAATSSSIATWVKTASGGETSVSGNDDSSQPLSYTIGQELVFINGVLQKRGDDYIANTGNSITGLTALTAGDIVSVWTVNAFSVSNAISNTLVDAKGDILIGTADNTPGRLAVGTNGQILTADSTTGTGLKWAAASAPAFVGCSVYANAHQTISTATWTDLTWNTEIFDTDGFHDNATNNARITIPTGKSGYYRITALAYWNAASATGTRVVAIAKNGTRQAVAELAGSSVAGPVNVRTQVFNLTAGDYLTVQVYQNSGGNMDIWKSDAPGSGGYQSQFEVEYLGA